MSSYSDYANALSRIYEARGQALAEGARAKGQIWSNALTQLGNIPAAFQQQQDLNQQRQIRGLQLQTGQMDLQQKQQQIASQQLLDQAWQKYGGDINAVTNQLAQSGQGHLIPALMKSHADYQKSVADATEATAKVEQTKAGLASQIGAEMQLYLDAGGPDAVSNAAGHGVVRISELQKKGLIDDANARMLTSQLDPSNPDQVKATIQRLVKAPSLLQKPEKIETTDAEGRPVTRFVSPTAGAEYPRVAPQKTRAELAVDAANPNSPTAEQSRKALDLLEKAVSDPNLQSKSVLLDGKPAEVLFNPKQGKYLRPETGEDVSARVKPMPPSSVVYPQSKPDKLIKVEHKDPATGRAVIEWLPESQVRGQTFEKPTSATVENRLASAEAVNQTGTDIIAKLKDPKYAAVVGPAMGRYSTLRDFIGNPPPEFAELAGQIESYALANMGVHGMRSTQGAEQIKKLLDAKHSPASLIAAIQGLNSFSTHFMQNEGRGGAAAQAPAPAPPTSGAPSYQDYLRSRQK